MKKNIFLVALLIFSIFLNIYFLIGKIEKKNFLLEENKNISTGSINVSSNKKNIKKQQEQISIKESLKGEKHFSYFFNEINGKYNLVDILIKEFQKVKSKEDYLRLRKKFGGDILLFTFIKIRNIELADKYMDYYLKYNLNFKGEKKGELLNIFNRILDEYYKKGYFNKLGYKDEDGTYDYFRLSLMNYSLDKKIEICKEGFKKEEDFNSCKKVVIYMTANKKNGYCKNMDKEYYKKWCNDTLDYLNKSN